MRRHSAGSPLAAVVTVLVTLGLVGAAVVPAVLLVVFAPVVGIPVAAGLFMLLIAGLGLAWFLSGWGGARRRAGPVTSAAATGPPRDSRQRRVLEPGAHLRAEPDGEPVAWLVPGMVVTEQERQGKTARVVTLRGTAGWVEAGLLVPLAGTGQADGSPSPGAGGRANGGSDG